MCVYPKRTIKEKIVFTKCVFLGRDVDGDLAVHGGRGRRANLADRVHKVWEGVKNVSDMSTYGRGGGQPVH